MKNCSQLTFNVTYRLQEYLAIVRSHALATATPPNPSRGQLLTTRLLVAVVGRIMFFVKSRRVGTCTFAIDETGISRHSKQGDTVVPWSKVDTLHTVDSCCSIQLFAGSTWRGEAPTHAK